MHAHNRILLTCRITQYHTLSYIAVVSISTALLPYPSSVKPKQPTSLRLSIPKLHVIQDVAILNVLYMANCLMFLENGREDFGIIISKFLKTIRRLCDTPPAAKKLGKYITCLSSSKIILFKSKTYS